MSAAKWIVGVLGWVTYGPIGALLGFWLGSVVDRHIDAAKQISGEGGSYRGQSRPYTTGSGGTYANPRPGGYSATEQRNSFMLSLLVLSSAVIKADGKTLRAEVDCVRAFIRQNFGESAVEEAINILRGLEKQTLNIYSVGQQIAQNMNYSQRLQLFDYLNKIAMADGEYSTSEKDVLEAIGSAIRLTSSDISSAIAMYYKDNNSAYSILEISPSATDEEVKAAYRKMAMKNHPDKVATLGPEVQKAAAEKFRKIQEAYEQVKRQRGMS